MKKEKEEEKVGGVGGLERLQLAEQNLQNLFLQKQVFQFELIETNNAIEELKKSKDGDVFKIVGSLMFRSKKADLTKDLEKKRDILNLRIKVIEKQEEDIKNKVIETREQVLKDLKGLKKA